MSIGVRRRRQEDSHAPDRTTPTAHDRIASLAVVVATAVTANEHRDVLEFDVGDSEDGAFWAAFMRSKDPQPVRSAVGHLLPRPDAHRTVLWDGARELADALLQTVTTFR